MNLKKLFAGVAGVSLLAQTFVPLSVIHAAAADYPTEYQEAYDYAYDQGVTTVSPIDNAGLYRPIIRSEAAKMLSNWAENVKGLEADTSISPKFKDTAHVKGDLAEAIIRSAQLGIM
jgi:hypothetical protein